jgi:hypothetical protein
VSRFGAATKGKLSGRGASGAPEDQLRGPLEGLLSDLAELADAQPGVKRARVICLFDFGRLSPGLTTTPRSGPQPGWIHHGH